MVSLEEKDEFLSELRKVPLPRDTFDALWGHYVQERTWDRASAEGMASECLFHLVRNDKRAFKRIYSEFSRREPDSDTDWIYNDFVIFVLVCCVKKFGEDSTWLGDLISARKDLKKDGSRNIPSTFIGILKDNWGSADLIMQLVIAFEDITGRTVQVEDKELADLFDEIWSRSFPSNRSQLLNLLDLYSIGAIVRRKGLDNSKNRSKILQSSSTFYLRTKMVAKIASWGLPLAVLLGVTWLAYEVAANKGDHTSNIILSVLGVIGIGGLLGARRKASEAIQIFLLWICGFDKKVLDLQAGGDPRQTTSVRR